MQNNSLVPQPKRPFLIVTPPYTRLSAGVTALHLLCHYLNRAGEQAFIFHHPPSESPIRSLPFFATKFEQPEYPFGFQAPVATQSILDAYISIDLFPIVIYPEVFDNPLNAPFFGRYILNYPGLLAPKYRSKENFSIAYSKILAEYVTSEYTDHPKCEKVLFMPTVDLSYWAPPASNIARTGSCYYAGKLKAIHQSVATDFSGRGTEILRSDLMPRSAVREIFQRSEIFYCYEDTALAIEAELCGCRTVFVKTEHFAGPTLAASELGWERKFEGDSREKIGDIRENRIDIRQTLISHISHAPQKIATMALQWQTLADATKPRGTLKFDQELHLIYMRGGLAIQQGDQNAAMDFAKQQIPGPKINPFTDAARRILRALKRDGFFRTGKRIVRAFAKHGFLRAVKILIRKIKGLPRDEAT